jgi:hypothetical protein
MAVWLVECATSVAAQLLATHIGTAVNSPVGRQTMSAPAILIDFHANHKEGLSSEAVRKSPKRGTFHS